MYDEIRYVELLNVLHIIMSEKEKSAKPVFPDDEFVILIDPLTHLVTGSGLQISLEPAELYLTNREVYVKPIYNNFEHVSISLFNITTFEQKEINDCQVLCINGLNDALIQIFIPDLAQMLSFAEILTKLLAASESGQNECDSLSLKIQRYVKQSGTLKHFYLLYQSNKNLFDESASTNPYIETPIAYISRLNPAQIYIDSFINLAELSQLSVFALFLLIIGILSIIFSYIDFGVCLCGIGFVCITKYGLDLAFSKVPDIDPPTFNPTYYKKFPKFFYAYETFVESARRRILWTSPKQTLDTVLFLLASGLMFTCNDPALLLAFSMFGLGFVERWNPWGFGSLMEILKTLFQFN